MVISFSVLEKNDCSALVFTDTTGTGVSGWGSGSGQMEVSDINGDANTLELQISKTNASGTIIYDYIDLYTLAVDGGPWSNSTDLVFTITPEHLLVNGVLESGVTGESLIEDAIYDCTYLLNRGQTSRPYVGNVYSNTVIFTYNQVKVTIYSRLRLLPDVYNAYDSRSKEVGDVLLMYTLMRSLEAMAYVSLQTKLITTLSTLQKLIINGSNYTWQS